MKKNNLTLDNMLFYRRVRKNYDDGRTKRYTYDKENDLLILHKPSFFSRVRQPSVYKAILLEYTPCVCKIEPTDGVTGITIEDISRIKIEGYEIGVELCPVDNTNCVENSNKWKRNKAHAIITMKCIKEVEDDEDTQKDLFSDVLCRQLCEHSAKRGWIIEPEPE